MSRNYLQGKFIPKNPQKYAGDANLICFRSSWERKLMIRFDNDPNILKWASEELIIPYFSPIDSREHRYFPDFIIEYIDKNKNVKKAVIEVKPNKETKPPQLSPKGRSTKRYIQESMTYIVNEAKWKAAEAWCAKYGWDFIIFTEKDLGV